MPLTTRLYLGTLLLSPYVPSWQVTGGQFFPSTHGTESYVGPTVSLVIFTNKVLPQKLFVACLVRMSVAESTECKMIGTFLNSKTPGSGLGLIMVLFWHCSLGQRRTMTTTVRIVQCPR